MSSTGTSTTEIARRLFTIWDALVENDIKVKNTHPFDAVKVSRVLALTHHVRKLGGASLELLSSHGVLVAVPSIRAGFENALTAMWIAQSSDGAQAWLAQDPAARRAIQKTLRTTDNPELHQ
ncbi:hypothetical protein I0Q12_00025, partial [Rhodococcus sp. CX]|uniref:hypothetical protein n=1 Tax=Rhodococcus sp. CX TaxID=2789880 RepID=UPI0018CEAC8E